MMLTIHGLPPMVKYHDLKVLIKKECNITDFILDNLVAEPGSGGVKKVRIGVSDDREGGYLMKCLDGYNFSGNILRVFPVGKTPQLNAGPNFDQRGGYPPRNDMPNQGGPNFGNRMDMMGRNDVMHGRPDAMHGRPDMHRGPDMMHSRPDPMQRGPDPMHRGPDPMHRGPDPMRGPDPIRGPDPMRGRPDAMQRGPDPMQRGPDPMRGRPDPMQRGPDPMQRGPDPMQRGPDPMRGRPDPVQNRPDPWSISGNQWGPNQGPNQPPIQNNFNYQQKPQGMAPYGQGPGGGDMRPFDQQDQFPPNRPGMPQDSGYGFPPKNDMLDGGRRNLRCVEIVNEPLNRPIASRLLSQGYDGPKPITIMKDNFQGPQYNLDRQGMAGPGQGHYPSQGHGGPAAGPGPGPGGWSQPMQGPKSGPMPYDRKYPELDKRPVPKNIPEGPRNHDNYKEFDKGPRFSPRRDVPMRRDSPGRRMSPGRKPSPGRRLSPGDRRVARRESPHRRPLSPPGHKRSPGRRSPGRRDSPSRTMRYSPPRRFAEKPIDKYGGPAKDVRPAYEPPSAQNQDMYPGGYRPSLQENIQYPVPGLRPQESRSLPWQHEREKAFPPVKKDEDRRDSRHAKFEPRIDDPKRSPRKSRSPIRRERSPIQDRHRKHSGSPRSSRSPRRSWALEKRRSPDDREAPPPPIWPGQSTSRDDQYRNRPGFSERSDDKVKRAPVWEMKSIPEKDDRLDRRPVVEERRFEDIRVRSDLGPRAMPLTRHREPSPRGRDFKPDDRLPSREPKFEPRDPKFEPRDPKFEPRDPKFESRREPKFEPREGFSRDDDFRRQELEKRYDRSEYRDAPRPGNDYHKTEHPRHPDPKREDFSRPQREEMKTLGKHPTTATFDKEFEDIYKRAVEFREKAEELRRREEREDRERRDVERHGARDDKKYRGDERREERDNRGDPRFVERSRFDEPPTPRRHHAEPARRDRDANWKHEEERKRDDFAGLKVKKDKAVVEIAEKMIHKYGCEWTSDIKNRVMEELKLSLAKILKDMFGNADVSFIEMVIKFNAKYDTRDQLKIFNDVMDSFPKHYRTMKRPAEEPVRAVAAKSARRNPDMNRDVIPPANEVQSVPDWMGLQAQMVMSQYDMNAAVMSQMMMQTPVMVPAPNYVTPYEEVTEQPQPPQDLSGFDSEKPEQDNLYLCKDDFEPYTDIQAEYLKKFLISQIVKASSQGWSPDFTIKGLQSMYRYELATKDESTRNWIMDLDFSDFQLFNVLVYTKEELWYERAAVWLPGHSRCRNIEPLTKLKLQNKKLDGVNIGKWKFVKKIVNAKGTRVYVDMPPSSARALEKHKMLLSYELQKVSVFLKAVAVDKDVFDAGMREMSMQDQAEIVAAAQNATMPSLGHDPNIVKIGLKGSKALTVTQARKIKDMVIYHIFKYHQDNGSSKTDFVKYGFCLPGFFGVIPENNESKRWLSSINIGKLNKHAVVVLGADDSSTKYIKMFVTIKNEFSLMIPLVMERLKQSNQGVKGLNFNLWKPEKLRLSRDRTRAVEMTVKMDIESVETIIKMKYKLDYLDERHKTQTATVKSEYPDSKLVSVIKKYKAEANDSYDVANMELASSDDDDDIVYLGKLN